MILLNTYQKILIGLMFVIISISTISMIGYHYKKSTNLNVGQEGVAIDREIDASLRDFVEIFSKAMFETDSDIFKTLIDNDGIYSITYFVDGRDPNTVLHLYKNDIRDDLVLAKNNKAGLTLGTEFGADDTRSMPIHDTNLSLDINWHRNNKELIEQKLESIISTLQKINLINNEPIPQVFILKNNLFAFAISNGVLEPEPEFTGEWVIFEKTNNEYRLRAIMKLQ